MNSNSGFLTGVALWIAIFIIFKVISLDVSRDNIETRIEDIENHPIFQHEAAKIEQKFCD